MTARRNKYKAVATVVDGVRFASKAEAKRDAELVMLEKLGEITCLERQPKLDLEVNGEKVCRYVADWAYWEKEPGNNRGAMRFVIEDKKGVQTQAFKIKWKLAKALYPHIEWRLT